MIRQTILNAIKAKAVTRVSVSLYAGIRRATFLDYLNGHSDMLCSNLEKVFECLDIDVAFKGSQGKKSKTKKM